MSESRLQRELRRGNTWTETSPFGHRVYWCWWAGYGAMGGKYVKRVLIGRAALDRHTPDVPQCPYCGKTADVVASGGDLGDGVRYICPDGHPWGAGPAPRPATDAKKEGE